MRAVVVDRFGGPEVLAVKEVETPEVGDGQVRIVTHAAAVNPVDVATRSGALSDAGLHKGARVRLGWDVYGQVDAIGAGVHRLRVGQAVIGLSDRLSAESKTHADLVVLDEMAVAAVSSDLDPQVGACLPLAGSTATQALDKLALSIGSCLLVTGAGGAVGSLAVQLAVLRGIRVIGSARSWDEDLVATLGAEWFVEATSDLGSRVRSLVPGGVHGAIDTAGLGSASLDAVSNGGTHISLNVTDRPAPLRAVRSESLAISADWQHLSVLASLAATGALNLQVSHVYSLADVRNAQEALAAGGLRGRIVLRP